MAKRRAAGSTGAARSVPAGRRRGWTSITALLLASGCSDAPRVDSYWVRADLRGAYGFPTAGFVRAREDADEGELEGDNVRWKRDLDLEGSLGYGARVDVRPLHETELSFTYDLFDGFHGADTLGRARRYDGRVYPEGEQVRSELEWRRVTASAAHRVLALGNPSGPSGPLADILVRAGVEGSTFDTELRGNTVPEEKRELRTGAPFVALEGRAAILPRIVFEHSLAAGYWNHEGSRLELFSATATFRLRVWGPLDALVGYEFAYRDGKASFENGEITRVDLTMHAVQLGLGLQF